MLSSRERPLEDELRLAPVLPYADAAKQCQWSSIIWVKNAAVEAAAVKQREIGFERGIVRRVTARSA